jgi:hypothetical protein
MLTRVSTLIKKFTKHVVVAKKYRFSGIYLPFVRHMARPVANCWQSKITGLKLHS